MADSVSRQLLSLTLIPRHPRSVSTRFIQNELNQAGFEAPLRMVQRDLEQLTLRWPLICNDSQRPYQWSWMQEAKTMVFPIIDPVQALTIAMAEQHLKQLMPKNSFKRIQSYFKMANEALSDKNQSKLKSWVNKIRIMPRGQPLVMASARNDVEKVIYECLLNDQKMRALYRKRDASESSEYFINPLGLVVRSAVTYLICALDKDPNNPRYLPIHRFTKVVNIHKPAAIPNNFNLDHFIHKNNLGFLMSNKILNLELIFESQSGFHLTETPLNNSQTLTYLDNGTIKVKAKVADTSELRFWISGFGPNVEVIKPKSLRREFINRAKQLKRIYKDRI